ncbi:hypothetical protein BpHYR1_045853 [Brachionus plicatilis]|uniref:Uncharacterized protein n=1 Tax=Brachionus plicatilis TaxID=10195 RepID=A0A3M7RBD1_BRAPC|nr:hypothetical protein BpHYR1_045853 [Brachionus plicatilis]
METNQALLLATTFIFTFKCKFLIVGCPFSNHKFLTASFPASTIKEDIMNNSFRMMKFFKLSGIENKWNFIKDNIVSAIESCCSLIKLKAELFKSHKSQSKSKL